MKRNHFTRRAFALSSIALTAFGLSSFATVSAADNKTVPETPLTAAGNTLAEKYGALLKAAQAEIETALPKIDEQRKAAYMKTYEAEQAAEAEAKKKQAVLAANQGAAGMVAHRKNWVSKATTAVAAAQEKLKQAATDDARKAAQEALEKEQKNRATGEEELKKSEAAVEMAKVEEPKLAGELKVAQDALAKAQGDTLKAVNELGLNSFLASDKLDATFAKYVVLTQATPRGLAEFACRARSRRPWWRSYWRMTC